MEPINTVKIGFKTYVLERPNEIITVAASVPSCEPLRAGRSANSELLAHATATPFTLINNIETNADRPPVVDRKFWLRACLKTRFWRIFEHNFSSG